MSDDAVPTVSEDIRTILVAFDFGEGPLPRKALLAAREHREEIIPELLRVFREEFECVKRGKPTPSFLSTMALFLLVEFRAEALLPIMLESLHLPEDTVDALYGDDFTTGDLGGILYRLGVTLEELDAVIRNKQAGMFVRWEVLKCFYFFVRDQRLSKEELIGRFHTYLKEANESRDKDLANVLVNELVDCAALETVPEIEKAFERQLVDPFLISREDVPQIMQEGEAGFQKILEQLQDDYSDCIAEMETWYCFKPKEPERRPPVRFGGGDAESFFDIETANREWSERIGRNDPCPCGSGKKYKKCCLKK